MAHTAGDEPVDWLRAGQALQRMLLTTTADGVAVSFLNQPIEVPELRAELRELLGTGAPQLLQNWPMVSVPQEGQAKVPLIEGRVAFIRYHPECAVCAL